MRSFFSSLFFNTSITLERDFIYIPNQTQIFMILDAQLIVLLMEAVGT